MKDRLEFAGMALTHPGKVRENNEDVVLVLESTHGMLCVVADGMGGHVGGERASRLACEAVECVWGEGELSREGIAAVERMVLDADRAICEDARSEPQYNGMGTTLTLGVIRGDGLYFAHVGDSRLYLLRRGVLTQLTEDHTPIQQLVNLGHLTAEEARHSPYRHQLSQALGLNLDLDIHSGEEMLHPGDRLLFCSDGLYGMVGGEDITHLLGDTASPEEAAEKLVGAANDGGGEDNISVVVVFAEKEELHG
jgi:PPM family protein phosphatase